MRGQSLRPLPAPSAAAPPALQVPAVDGGPAVQEVPAQLRVAHLGSQDQRRGAVLGSAGGRMSRGGSDPPTGHPAPDISPISVSHPTLCCIAGQPQPGIAGPGAEGPHLILAVQGSLEVTEDLGAGDAAAGSCGQGQRLSTAPDGDMSRTGLALSPLTRQVQRSPATAIGHVHGAGGLGGEPGLQEDGDRGTDCSSGSVAW